MSNRLSLYNHTAFPCLTFPAFRHLPTTQWFRDTKKRISIVVSDFLHLTSGDIGTFDRSVCVVGRGYYSNCCITTAVDLEVIGINTNEVFRRLRPPRSMERFHNIREMTSHHVCMGVKSTSALEEKNRKIYIPGTPEYIFKRIFFQP